MVLHLVHSWNISLAFLELKVILSFINGANICSNRKRKVDSRPEYGTYDCERLMQCSPYNGNYRFIISPVVPIERKDVPREKSPSGPRFSTFNKIETYVIQLIASWSLCNIIQIHWYVNLKQTSYTFSSLIVWINRSMIRLKSWRRHCSLWLI